MRSVALVTGPTSEPLHIDYAKQHLRIDHTEEDVYVEGLIAAVRSECEAWRNECLVSQTWDLRLDGWPNDDIIIPRVPVASVSSITYVDTDGVTQTLATSYYTVDAYSRPARIALAYQQTWPTVRGVVNAITIRFVAGYVTPFDVDVTGDTLTTSGRNFSDDDVVRISLSGDQSAKLPGALQENVDYYVVSASGSSMQLSATSGGGAIDIKASGNPGAFYLGEIPEHVKHGMLIRLADLYENRESTMTQRLSEVPLSVESLYNTDRVHQLG